MSSRLITQSRYSICMTELATEMPRCFSISIQSLVAWRDALRAFTEPAIWIAPENSSSFSVSVVLPASGCEMIAKVRRRRTWGLRLDIVMRLERALPPRGRGVIIGARWHTAAMPELPDVTVYVEKLQARVQGDVLQRVRVLNPFVLRTAVPPISQAEGRRVEGVERLGKRIVLRLEGELMLVIHLMIAGRLRWLAPGAKPPGKIALTVLEFGRGALVLTEAGSKRRASIHLLAGRAALGEMDRGGIEVLSADFDELQVAARRRKPHAQALAHRPAAVQRHRQRVLRRDPAPREAVAGGVDAIARRRRHRALAQSNARSDERMDRAHARRSRASGGWPEKVTAFRPEMAVHGRYGQPCPVCGAPVQRIVYADNETNYCARCQTGGKLLADRALSRLLKSSWPRSIDELE